MPTDPKRPPPHDPSHPLTEIEKAVFGHDAKRHPIIGDLVIEQSMGMGDATADAQAIAYVENLAKSDPATAAMWRKKLSMAKK